MRKARDMNLGWRLASITLFSSLLISNGQAASTDDSASHGIKCWKNKEGVRECGNIVPPEYAQQGSETKDKFGVTIGTTGRAKTMQELEVERAANREQEVAAEEAKKREAADRVLLDTFTTEDDMILTRDGQVAHLDSQIHLVQSHIEKLQKNLDQMIDSWFVTRVWRVVEDIGPGVDYPNCIKCSIHMFCCSHRIWIKTLFDQTCDKRRIMSRICNGVRDTSIEIGD